MLDMRHEQHALFVHIGIWRSVVMEKEILSGRLDVCQSPGILNFCRKALLAQTWHTL
jgi:hypothetical protein